MQLQELIFIISGQTFAETMAECYHLKQGSFGHYDFNLTSAAELGHTECLRSLIAAGADVAIGTTKNLVYTLEQRCFGQLRTVMLPPLVC